MFNLFKELNAVHAWHLYVIRINRERLKINRAQFIEALRTRNIGASVHFIPLHLHPFYQNQYGFKRGDFPVAEAIYEDIISLPLYTKMTVQDVQDVIETVKHIAAQY